MLGRQHFARVGWLAHLKDARKNKVVRLLARQCVHTSNDYADTTVVTDTRFDQGLCTEVADEERVPWGTQG